MSGPLTLDTIDPRFCTLRDWTDAMMFPLLDKVKAPILGGDVPRLDNLDAWEEWAMTVIQSPNISKYSPPDPRLFTNWQDWAFRFIQVLS